MIKAGIAWLDVVVSKIWHRVLIARITDLLHERKINHFSLFPPKAKVVHNDSCYAKQVLWVKKSNVDFVNANIIGANFVRANLAHACFGYVDFNQCLLDDTNLQKTKFFSVENLTVKQVKTAKNCSEGIYDAKMSSKLN